MTKTTSKTSRRQPRRNRCIIVRIGRDQVEALVAELSATHKTLSGALASLIWAAATRSDRRSRR